MRRLHLHGLPGSAAEAPVLDRVAVPVRLHLGLRDAWVPPAMVRALARRLPGPVEVVTHDAGHFGTLRAALAPGPDAV